MYFLSPWWKSLERKCIVSNLFTANSIFFFALQIFKQAQIVHKNKRKILRLFLPVRNHPPIIWQESLVHISDKKPRVVIRERAVIFTIYLILYHIPTPHQPVTARGYDDRPDHSYVRKTLCCYFYLCFPPDFLTVVIRLHPGSLEHWPRISVYEYKVR